jgi:hypothetical protein
MPECSEERIVIERRSFRCLRRCGRQAEFLEDVSSAFHELRPLLDQRVATP